MTRWIAYAVLASLGSLAAGPATPRAADAIVPNDNRQTAGTLRNGVLTVAIEARTGVWRPEGDSGRALDVAAFAEAGKALSTPGPVIRVPLGTEIRATIHNRLDRPLTVYGFGAPGSPDSVTIPVNGSAPLRFKATALGTYFYFARRGALGAAPRPEVTPVRDPP